MRSTQFEEHEHHGEAARVRLAKSVPVRHTKLGKRRAKAKLQQRSK